VITAEDLARTYSGSVPQSHDRRRDIVPAATCRDIAGTLFGDGGIDNSQQASLIESYSALGDANPLAYSVNPLVKAGADYVGRVSRAAYNDPEGAGWGVASLAVNLGPDLWNYATDVQQLLAAGPWGQFGENNPLHIEPLMPDSTTRCAAASLGVPPLPSYCRSAPPSWERQQTPCWMPSLSVRMA
jgi:hypothetical protein